jgi:hypothetical protein
MQIAEGKNPKKIQGIPKFASELMQPMKPPAERNQGGRL